MKYDYRKSLVAVALIFGICPINIHENRNFIELPNASIDNLINVYNIGQTSDGSMGRLAIGGYSARLFNNATQGTVDAADSAAYIPWGNGKVYIADHASQGFNIIKTLGSGSSATITDDTTIVYLTMNTSYQGINTGHGINLSDGRYSENVNDGNYVMYTCNDSSGVSVTVTYWNVTNNVSKITNGIEAFVKRMYTTCLGRDAETAGYNFWTNRLANGMTGSEVAYSFFFSDEFKEKNYCNEHYIYRLYETILGREPDVSGLSNWINVLNLGAKREEVLNGFLSSQEFSNFCSSAGVSRGNGIVIPERGTVQTGFCSLDGKMDSAVGNYVLRMYTSCLGREAEAGGLANWVKALNNGSANSRDIALGFFFSQEFIQQNNDNSTFLNKLYLTIMGREADADGYANWMQVLNSGVSRKTVLNGFIESAEWNSICQKYGIRK